MNLKQRIYCMSTHALFMQIHHFSQTANKTKPGHDHQVHETQEKNVIVVNVYGLKKKMESVIGARVSCPDFQDED